MSSLSAVIKAAAGDLHAGISDFYLGFAQNHKPAARSVRNLQRHAPFRVDASDLNFQSTG